MELKIVSARDRRQLSAEGRTSLISEYEYMLDDLGPFIYHVEKAEDTPEAFRTEIARRKAIVTQKG